MYQWFEEVGYDVDLDALHARFPAVGWQSLADWSVEAFATLGAA